MSNRHSTLGAPRVLMRAVAEKCEAGSRDLQHRRCPHPGSFFVTRAMCGAVGSIRSPPCFVRYSLIYKDFLDMVGRGRFGLFLRS